MAVEKPILALVPPGDARDFVVHSRLGVVCEPTDIEQIAQTLLKLIEKHRAHRLDVNPDRQFIEKFERRKLTAKLAEVFDFVTS